MSGFQRLNIVRNTRIVAGLAAGMVVAVSLSGSPLMAASCRADAMAGIDWRECNKRLLMLGGSNLDLAMLYGTDFTYTDLRGSSLKGANLEKAKLIRTALGGEPAGRQPDEGGSLPQRLFRRRRHQRKIHQCGNAADQFQQGQTGRRGFYQG